METFVVPYNRYYLQVVQFIDLIQIEKTDQ